MVSIARPGTPVASPRWSLARAYRRVRPAEGWTSVVLLAIIVLATAWTVTRTEIAPDGLSIAILALGGLLTGLGLAKLSPPDLVAHIIAIFSGMIVSLVLAIERMPLSDGGFLSRAQALAELSAEWIGQAQAGEPLDDPRLLAIMLGAAIWLVAYTSAWVLFRRGWLTTALALPVIIALANLGYAPEEGTLPLLVIILAATMLAARHAAFRRQVEWSRARLPYPRRIPSRFLASGVAFAIIVGLVAWTLPLTARDALLGSAWERLSEPLKELTERWDEAASRLGAPGETSGGAYSAFGEQFKLGGHLELSDEPVILMHPSGGPMRPAYLAGQRYDEYTGSGWASTVDASFQRQGPDGRRYSPRLSFRTGQGVHLSPEVTTDRSQVDATLTVVRPKGDLLFTLDTYLAADRRTNVQLPWQQLDNARFALDDQSLPRLPLDLRRIGVLVARGTYPPDTGAPAPLPLDPTLAAEVSAEQESLRGRFLDVGWEVGADGRAQALIVSGQLPIYDDVAAVFSQEPVAAGNTYEVTGLTSMASPDQLRAAGVDYPEWVTDRYLQLPDTITDRTRELAAQLSAGLSNPFDIAMAVEDYVRSTITYNEDIQPPPPGQDVVDYVLFESQEGYCEYYASAMAVLLRTQGIPARVVGGYYPAPYDPAQNGHLYREKNAHLWVEVFFPEFGWIPFEPTANREQLEYGDIVAAAEEPALPTPEPTPLPTPEATPPPVAETPPPPDEPETEGNNLFSQPSRLALWAGILLAGILVLALVATTVTWFAGFRGLSPMAALYARAIRAGRWLGVQSSPALTPREYADRVGRAVPSAQGPARVVADLYTIERYAGRRPEEAALRRARLAWRELRRIAIGTMLGRKRGGTRS